MKKRILALALAGTTAFSVFGAAVSANAAYNTNSAQYVTNNDQYKQYTPVAKVVASTYTSTKAGTAYVDMNDGANAGTRFTLAAKKDTSKNEYTSVDEYIADKYDTKEEYELVVDYVNKGVAYVDGQPNVDGLRTMGITPVTGVDNTAQWKYGTENGKDKVWNSLAEALAAYEKDNANVTKSTYYRLKTNVDTHKTLTEYANLNSASVYKAKIQTVQTSDPSATGGVKVSADSSKTTYDAITDNGSTWGFNGATSADTTIYPWTESSIYADANGLYFRQNVGRKNDRMAFAEPLDQIADLDDLHGVKADGRLVKDQYFGIADQSLRHTDSLPVTFGKVFDQTLLHMVDLDPAADLVDMLLFRDLALFQIVDKPEIALNRHIHVQGRQLGKVSDLLLGFDRVVENIKAVDRN